MGGYKCQRCDAKQEYIPTYQYLKIDKKIFYLCDSCFEVAKWFIYGKESDLNTEKTAEFDFGGTIREGQNSREIKISKKARSTLNSWFDSADSIIKRLDDL